MNRSKLAIIGAGGHAKVCLDISERMKKWTEIDFLDDNNNGDFLGKKIVNKISNFKEYKESHDFIIAIGDNEVRERLYQQLVDKGCSITILIDPSSIVSKYSAIGQGTVIMPLAVINANTTVGANCIINTSAVIEHDCKVSNHVHVSPKSIICGSVIIGKNSWVGAGSILKNNIHIGNNVLIGVGSVVVKDLREPGVYYSEDRSFEKKRNNV